MKLFRCKVRVNFLRPRSVAYIPTHLHSRCGTARTHRTAMIASIWVLIITLLPHKFILGQIEATSNAKDVSMLSNSFIAEIFQTFNGDMENLVFSPFSFASNLVMLLEGASGETANELETSLNLTKDSLQGIRMGFKYFYDKFEARRGEHEAAGTYNKIFVQEGNELLPTYKDTVTKYYRANISEIPKNDNAVPLEFHSDTGILSHWQDYEHLPVYMFLSHETSAPFTSNEKVALVPMIPQVGVFRSGHVEYLNSTAVELLFEAKTVSLLLLIPEETDGITSLIQKLSNVSIPNVLDELQEGETEISMPQLAFAVRNLDFTTILKKRGIGYAMNSTGADFSMLSSSGNVYLKSLTQTAYFTSSFSSVKAVAEGFPKFVKSEKHSGDPGKGSLRRKRSINRVKADHPFLFFVIFKESGLVLLCGKIENPTQTP